MGEGDCFADPRPGKYIVVYLDPDGGWLFVASPLEDYQPVWCSSAEDIPQEIEQRIEEQVARGGFFHGG